MDAGAPTIDSLFTKRNLRALAILWRAIGQVGNAESREFLKFIFTANVESLLHLYVVGVFTAFTLSQTGMVRYWRRTRDRGWQRRAAVNAAINLIELKSRRNIPLENAAEPVEPANHADRGDMRQVLRLAMAFIQLSHDTSECRRETLATRMRPMVERPPSGCV